jgi:hypothetical protein
VLGIILQIVPIFQDEAWNQRCKVFSDDIDRKLDRLELKSLKKWLLRRLKALNVVIFYFHMHFFD